MSIRTIQLFLFGMAIGNAISAWLLRQPQAGIPGCCLALVGIGFRLLRPPVPANGAPQTQADASPEVTSK